MNDSRTCLFVSIVRDTILTLVSFIVIGSLYGVDLGLDGAVVAAIAFAADRPRAHVVDPHHRVLALDVVVTGDRHPLERHPHHRALDFLDHVPAVEEHLAHRFHLRHHGLRPRLHPHLGRRPSSSPAISANCLVMRPGGRGLLPRGHFLGRELGLFARLGFLLRECAGSDRRQRDCNGEHKDDVFLTSFLLRVAPGACRTSWVVPTRTTESRFLTAVHGWFIPRPA